MVELAVFSTLGIFLACVGLGLVAVLIVFWAWVRAMGRGPTS